MKEIQLTKGMVAFVDDDDYDRIYKLKWRTLIGRSTMYAITTHKGKTIFMHRCIIDVNNLSSVVDHIDFNGLNNCKNNLRITTIQQNLQHRRGPQKNNTSGYRGVFWSKYINKWLARIKIDGKARHIGCFSSKEEAAKAFDVVSKIFRGQYCGRPNIV